MPRYLAIVRCLFSHVNRKNFSPVRRGGIFRTLAMRKHGRCTHDWLMPRIKTAQSAVRFPEKIERYGDTPRAKLGSLRAHAQS